ncbi:hypothetical protein SKA53_00400 [Yoonia vestfoldensis SKA53]|jgi:hypothetical protein|uniref:Uncharacterized protein n=1 Tax=Yoonia vestfoldensis SKA53 TaxID=314232 RepID=A3V927_9RHOB|nr:hypothetical protein SKA53_00400 [Yoonia vestfoldensis SKA53]
MAGRVTCVLLDGVFQGAGIATSRGIDAKQADVSVYDPESCAKLQAGTASALTASHAPSKEQV